MIKQRHDPKAKGPGGTGACDRISDSPRATEGAGPKEALLDLGLFVVDVLAHERVVLLHFQLIGMEALVLRGDVEVAGPGGRQQFDLFAHSYSSLGGGP
jgi:hypothetical protein